MAVCKSEASLIYLVRHRTVTLSRKGREKGKRRQRKSKTSLVRKLWGQKGMRGEKKGRPHPYLQTRVLGMKP